VIHTAKRPFISSLAINQSINQEKENNIERTSQSIHKQSAQAKYIYESISNESWHCNATRKGIRDSWVGLTETSFRCPFGRGVPFHDCYFSEFSLGT